eukprot:3319182-Rhodomonas_salina.2
MLCAAPDPTSAVHLHVYPPPPPAVTNPKPSTSTGVARGGKDEAAWGAGKGAVCSRKAKGRAAGRAAPPRKRNGARAEDESGGGGGGAAAEADEAAGVGRLLVAEAARGGLRRERVEAGAEERHARAAARGARRGVDGAGGGEDAEGAVEVVQAQRGVSFLQLHLHVHRWEVPAWDGATRLEGAHDCGWR